MARESTLPEEWQELIKAYGGIKKFCMEAGFAESTLYKISRGLAAPSPQNRQAINQLAERKKLKSPLPTTIEDAKSTKQGELLDVDRTVLEYLGIMIGAGDEVPKEFLDRYARRIGSEMLIKIAESDSYSVNAHRAVSKLLGL